MLNDAKINQLISNCCPNEKFYGIFVYSTPTLEQAFILKEKAGFATKLYVVGINPEKIVVVGIDMFGEPLWSGVLAKDQIKTVKYSNYMFGLGKTIVIVTKDGEKLNLKANRIVGGVKMQKENLTAIEGIIKNGAFAS